MDISKGSVVERIARVLAGQRLSANGNGQGISVSAEVDASWQLYVDDARAVLRTLREPDQVMADAGDPQVWERMILAAIGEASR
jgi:hypothetical protein